MAALARDRVTTANEIAGTRIVRHLGIVRGITVRSRSVIGNFGAALQTTRPVYPADPDPSSPDKTFAVKAKPKVTGVAKVGKQLRAVTSVFTPRPTSIRYQWLRGNKVIKGATKAAYKVTRKDRGRQLRVRVTAARKGYATKVVTSKPVRVKR